MQARPRVENRVSLESISACNHSWASNGSMGRSIRFVESTTESQLAFRQVSPFVRKNHATYQARKTVQGFSVFQFEWIRTTALQSRRVINF